MMQKESIEQPTEGEENKKEYSMINDPFFKPANWTDAKIFYKQANEIDLEEVVTK